MIKTFMNDNYKLLKLMYDNQIIVINKKFVPLTQMELSTELGFSKMKTNAIFLDLQQEGYIKKIARGKYCLSDKAERIVSTIDSENIYIVGDNLDALKHLLNSYSEQIKCIYIDPPYNTAKKDFVYPDDFKYTTKELMDKAGIEEDEANRILQLAGSSTHSAWLTFMFPRLLIASELLAPEGVIFISIDDNEQANLKLLCDDIFGPDNFQGMFVINTSPSAIDYGHIAKQHEYCLMYTKHPLAATTTIQYNFVIETKDVSSNGSLRDDEKRKILCGIEFFKQLKAEGYNVIFEEQLKTDNIVAMIKKSVAK